MENILGGYPQKPRSVADTGLPPNFLADLALKIIYVQGFTLGAELATAIRLPFEKVVDATLEALRRDGLIEVGSSDGASAASYEYAISREGRLRARELMDQSQYTGPAPVNLATYTQMVKAQSLGSQGVTPDDLNRGLSHLVLPEDLLSQLGTAVNAGKAIFLFGNTGNGKTSIGLGIGATLPGAIWVPYAVVAESEVIQVFDAVAHQVVGEDVESGEASSTRKGLLRHLAVEKKEDGRWVRNREMLDERWALIKRPLIVGGGELTLKDLDLVYDSALKYHQAPHQMKANGGIFLVDDLGRQKVSAREILNRWILPLERRVDYLTPARGNRIEAPFDTLLLFATNLDPSQVADEVFLRRLRYRIHVTDPTWGAYTEIFRREATKHGLAFSEEAIKHVMREYYVKPKRQPRGVHPRDILDELMDIARYRGITPMLSSDLLDLACQAYFLKDEAPNASR